MRIRSREGVRSGMERLSRPAFARNILFGGLLALVATVSVVSAGESAPQHDRLPVPLAICEAFGDRHCGPALRVAWCESRLDPRARNGQYLGLFQMGAWERSRFGHGPTAYEQSRAAHRYFVASGRDWSPWSCRRAA